MAFAGACVVQVLPEHCVFMFTIIYNKKTLVRKEGWILVKDEIKEVEYQVKLLSLNDCGSQIMRMLSTGGT